MISGGGTFLDVGCANGLLMESVAAWCAERGLAVEPYGVDISPALAELALPATAPVGRPHLYWQRPGVAPARRDALRLRTHPARLRAPACRADLVRHHLARTVRPGTGRLLVSDYAADPAAGHPHAAETLRVPRLPLSRARPAAATAPAAPCPTAWDNRRPCRSG